jgi:hypothetical protein
MAFYKSFNLLDNSGLNPASLVDNAHAIRRSAAGQTIVQGIRLATLSSFASWRTIEMISARNHREPRR